MTRYYGQITAEMTIEKIIPGLRSGNLQIAIYDLTKEKVYFSYGIINEDNKKINAYERPFIGLDLKAMFGHKND